MEDWRNMVCLVDGHGGVDDVGLDNLLVENRLDMLVDMVMDTLCLNYRSSGGRVGGMMSRGGVLVLALVTVKCLFEIPVAAMVDGLVLNICDTMRVLLGKGLFVL